MECYKGKAAFQGIAIGKIIEFKKEIKTIRRTRILDIKAELKRFDEAKATSISQLQILYDKAVKEVGEMNAAIFEVHQMMLEDEDYLDSIRNIIETQEVNAEYAVATTGDNFSDMFASMEDTYMKERAADIKDISERVISVLSNFDVSNNKLSEPSIIVADDLAPSETVQLDKTNVLAFVTRQGSTNSHTAILARTMNIPALIGIPVKGDVVGKIGIVNGFNGEFIIEPDDDSLKKAVEKQKEVMAKRKMFAEMKDKETITKSGRKINLYCNIGDVSDVGSVLQNDGEGIGLFRSEFLYLKQNNYPSEDLQFQAYKSVAELMAGKKVIIRTIDIGADKQIDYFQLDKEENPALGYRAVRICLDREDLFKTQLRALYRASAFGKISIMIPMIASLWEIQKVNKIAESVRKELEDKGIPFSKVEFGIMIETPAAVMISDELAKEVDFFSIGTNDLTQYTLAVDRQNPKLDMFYDSHHPAILKMIKMTVDNGHKAGIWVGICGELGADITLTEEFVKMGVDELSVSPAMILPLRQKIREIE